MNIDGAMTQAPQQCHVITVLQEEVVMLFVTWLLEMAIIVIKREQVVSNVIL